MTTLTTHVRPQFLIALVGALLLWAPVTALVVGAAWLLAGLLVPLLFARGRPS